MAKKSLVFGAMLLSAILVLLPSASAQPPWNVGDSWAYKWDKDYSSSGSYSSLGAHVSGTYKGKAVYAYYVEYVGMENEYYRFNFHGVHYSWANIDLTFDSSTSYSGYYYNLTGSMKYQQQSLWVEFYGYFYLKEKTISGYYETHKVYAVYKLNCTVYSKEDVDYNLALYEHITSNYMGSGDYNVTAEGKGNFNISLELDFDEGIPFLPADTGSYTYYGSVMCDYRGHVKANVNGKMVATVSAGGYGSYPSYNDTWNINVDKDYSGSTSISYTFTVSGNNVTRPGFFTNMGTTVLSNVGCVWDPWGSIYHTRSTVNEPDVNDCARDLAYGTTATYDKSKGYYTSETNGAYGESKSTNKNEVDSIISNPKATYGAYQSESAGFNLLLLLIVAAVIIVVVIAVVVGVVLMRKKKQPPLAQQSQQAYAMPPQYQQPQYPQQQYPQPQPPAQYPPQQPQQPQQPQPPTF